MKSRNNIFAAIDIGSTKIVCLIAVMDNNDNFKIIGHGYNISNGFKAGNIIDVKLAEISLLAAIEEAEKMAGINIDNVIININGNRIESQIIDSSILLNNHPITDKDINKLINQTLDQFDDENYEIVNYFPLEYSVDNEEAVKDPRMMLGNVLNCKIYLVTVSANILLNLSNCLARCHINIKDFILSSYASALACLTQDEMDNGCTLIDIGGATTSIAIFYKGNIIYSDVIMIGGNHVTSDIAHGLSINMNDAERIKILYGSVINIAFGKNEIIDLNTGDENEISYIKVSELTDIIRPRVEEIIELVQKYFAKMKISKFLTRKIILTGGTSQLAGLKDLSSALFESNVRIAFPKQIQSLPANYNSPSFSVIIGILLYAHNKFLQNKYEVKERESKRFSLLRRLFNWF